MLHASNSRKFRSESQFNVIRRLDFVLSDESCDTVAINDEIILETMYCTLLEAIVSKQREAYLDICSDLENGYKTPESSKLLTEIVKNCLGAPVKCGRKSRNIEKSLCRKRDPE